MLILWSIVTSISIGSLLAFYARRVNLLDRFGRALRITKLEFGVYTLAIMAIVLVVTVLIGPALARVSAVKGYKQFFNGSVTQARIVEDVCHRDGSCTHSYKCDPYLVTVVDSPAYTDSDGFYHSEQSHIETRYHECPYATVELDYVLDTNIGDTVTIAKNYFEPSPKPWRSGHSLPSDVHREIPERWSVAKMNLEAGFSDPVTSIHKYSNYLLASDNELYKKYDGNILKYKKLDLLPLHTVNFNNNKVMHDFGMRADKLLLAGGLTIASMPVWQDRLMRFNAALGSNLQGDMHVVMVPADKVDNPDEYINTLKAYWQSLGKSSIAKNGIILVIGVSDDGKTVEWSRSETGMPIGNGEMRTALNLELSGSKLIPDVLFGKVSATPTKINGKLKIKYDYTTSGKVGKIVFLDFPFKRACMECKDKEDNGVSFVDLKDEIPISFGAKVLMFFTVLFITTGLWGLALWYDPFKTNSAHHTNPNFDH